MPLISVDDHPPRRNARSFDLHDSATKAAAWVWHLHDSKPGVTTEGRFMSAQSRRRSSSSSDRRISRFHQEAAVSSTTKGGGRKVERPMWDCGSNLYDTFELVAFGNRLDRCLMEAVPLTPPPPICVQSHASPAHAPRMVSPLHKSGGVLRTLSLPKSTQTRSRQASTKTQGISTARVSLAKSRELSLSVFNQDQASSKRWPGVEKVMKAFKKVVVLHKQVGINVGCKQSINIVEPCQRPLQPSINEDIQEYVGDDESSMQKISKGRRKSLDEELLTGRRSKGNISEGAKEFSSKLQTSSQNYHKHLHHHHHHHHHHYLHHTLASESARLSPETLSKVYAEKGW
ncbi:hypothetical protein L7F22_060007 [Adiantum nelumboides]|nr:hypothetical protein [Adiantum nelumboides]